MIVITELQKTKQPLELIDLTEQELIALQGGVIPWANLAGAAIGGVTGGATAAVSGANPAGIASSTVGGAIGGFVSPVSSVGAAGSAITAGLASGVVGGTVGNLVDMYTNRRP